MAKATAGLEDLFDLSYLAAADAERSASRLGQRLITRLAQRVFLARHRSPYGRAHQIRTLGGEQPNLLQRFERCAKVLFGVPPHLVIHYANWIIAVVEFREDVRAHREIEGGTAPEHCSAITVIRRLPSRPEIAKSLWGRLQVTLAARFAATDIRTWSGKRPIPHNCCVGHGAAA